ncbi:MAG: response regulator [Methanobacteriota archaeon]
MRLLLVEDSEDDALLLVRVLKQGGFEPSYERVETEAALRAELAKGGWELVISDFNLPWLTGADVVRIVREGLPRMPIILISGNVGEDVGRQVMKAGASEFVEKRDLGRLVAAVDRLLPR